MKKVWSTLLVESCNECPNSHTCGKMFRDCPLPDEPKRVKGKQLIFTPIGYKKAVKGEWFKDRRGCLTPWLLERKTVDMYEVYTCEEIEVEIKVPHYRWMYAEKNTEDWNLLANYYPDEESVFNHCFWLIKATHDVRKIDFTERLM